MGPGREADLVGRSLWAFSGLVSPRCFLCRGLWSCTPRVHPRVNSSVRDRGRAPHTAVSYVCQGYKSFSEAFDRCAFRDSLALVPAGRSHEVRLLRFRIATNRPAQRVADFPFLQRLASPHPVRVHRRCTLALDQRAPLSLLQGRASLADPLLRCGVAERRAWRAAPRNPTESSAMPAASSRWPLPLRSLVFRSDHPGTISIAPAWPGEKLMARLFA